MLTILNKKILLKILGEHNIDSGRLIKEYKITQRTFEYNIKKINELLEKINIKIENSGKNYYIKTEEERIKLVSLLEMTDTLDKADRLIIMKFILFFGSGINLQRLSEDLEISLTTVKKDLNFIKSELDGIEYRKNVGFILKKHKTDDNAKLILLEKIISNPQIFEYLSARYTEFFSKNNRITGFLEYIKKELDFKMTTENYSLLHTYILLILNTDKEEKNNNEAFIKETEEFKIINDYWVSQDILSEKNMIRIADLVIGLSVQTNKLENWLNEEILVKKIIKKFADYIELNIEKDQILYECLIYHLKPAIYRMKKGIKLNNTVFKELLQEDDPALEIIDKVLKETEEDLEISFNEDEKYLLAYHFKASIDRNMYINRKKILLVCGLGYGTSKLLEKQLKENFNIDVIDIVAYHELEEAVRIYKNTDLIISTFDIEKNIKIPYIKIDTFLNEEDSQKILKKGVQRRKNKLLLSELLEIIEWGKNKDKKEITEILKEKYKELIVDDLDDNSKQINKLISVNRIKILDRVEGWEEGIRTAGELLEKDGFVNENYIDDMITTVKKFGAYIVIDNEVAIPHGNIENTLKNGISILVLKEPVNFTKSKKADILIGFSINDKRNHKEILDIVFEIAEKRNNLLKFNSEKDIYNYLLEDE